MSPQWDFEDFGAEPGPHQGFGMWNDIVIILSITVVLRTPVPTAEPRRVEFYPHLISLFWSQTGVPSVGRLALWYPDHEAKRLA